MTAFARFTRLLPSLFLVLGALAPSAAHADAFSDFRIPPHRWSSWTANLGGYMSHHSRDSDLGSSDDRQSHGEFSTFLVAGLEQDDLFVTGRVALGAHDNAGKQRQTSTFPVLHSVDDRGRFTVETLDLSTRLRGYPGGGPLGFEITAEFSGALLQDWRETEQTRQDPFGLFEQWARRESDRHTVHAFGGTVIGLGRVRDATGVYDAYLLEDRLRETGALSGPLSPEVRRQLAELFYIAPRISTVHDRPDKFFWREVERILHDHLASGALDAWSLYRARDVRRLARPIGFFLGPEVGIAQIHQGIESQEKYRTRLVDSTGTQESSYTRTNDSEGDRRSMSVGGRAEVHVPLGLRFQIDAASQLRYVGDEPRTLYLLSSAHGVYLLGDRWFADVFASHNRVAPDKAGTMSFPSNWEAGWGGSISYFIEDTWRAEVRFDSSRRYTEAARGEPALDERSSRVSVGISYLISGRLASPVLSETMTPYRPQIYY